MPAEGIYIGVDIIPHQQNGYIDKVIISCADKGRLRVSFHRFIRSEFVRAGIEELIAQDEFGDWMMMKFGKSVFNWGILAQAFSNEYVTEETE